MDRKSSGIYIETQTIDQIGTLNLVDMVQKDQV